MNEVTKRNFNALSEGLKQLRAEMQEVKKDSVRKDEQIQQLKAELGNLTGLYGRMMARTQGTGATA